MSGLVRLPFWVALDPGALASVNVHVAIGDEQWTAMQRMAEREGLTEIATQLYAIVEFSKPAAPEPDPWWWALKPGDKVKPAHDGVSVIVGSTGREWRKANIIGPDGQPTVWDVWAPGIDRPAEMICIFSGNAKAYPGGLWVMTADVARA
jgi:hypothetical protein